MDKMMEFRVEQAQHLAKAIADNEPEAVIERERKLLDDVDAFIKLFTSTEKRRARSNAARP